MSFLEQIIQDLQKEFGDSISDLCLIVPSRRAVLFLKQALARTYQKTLWAPKMVSIQDYVREMSGDQFPDPLPLVFDLYQVYMERMKRETPNFYESFEAFYSWGEMIVKDFDELDKYMVDAKQLFTNVRDLKEIESFFSIPEENHEIIKGFWRTLRGREVEPTEMQQKFLKIWEVLYDVYVAFKAQLKERNMSYDGMAYRTLVGELEAGERDMPHAKTIFIGFNALSTAEERLMKHLLETEQGIVYWDVDRAYFTPPGDRKQQIAGEEPGKFIRGYHRAWSDKRLASRLIVHEMAAELKQIEITGAPLHVTQAQYLGNLLNEDKIPEEDFRKCAIVLADEQLLFPVLYALPSYLTQLNITMGFRLRQTQIYSLLLTLMRLLNTLRLGPQQEMIFAHKEVEDILNNPYIKAHHPMLSQQIQEEIGKKNLLFVSQSFLMEKELSALLKHIFSPPKPDPTQQIKNLSPLIAYCEGILTQLLEDAQERQARLEAEYIYHFYRWFQQLREVLDQYKPALSLQGFTRLVRESMQKVRIPFEGEPLVGVQIMGFLETRVLDFDRVYILGANEGSLPDTSIGNSFIPYNLRKGFGLPTYEEKDAIYAYHFYRLLQRSKEVHLIYNQEVSDAGGPKEQSRFILQIEHFFRKESNLRPEPWIVSTPAPYAKKPEISIPNSPTIREALYHRFHQSGKARKYFSATALTTYIACRLRFYFYYIAKIREPNQVEESMEANTFGSVLHETMEYLYTPYVGKVLDKETIQGLKKELPAAMRKAFADNELAWGYELRGKNYLLRGVIEDLCKRILQEDAKSESFMVRGLEADDFQTAIDIDGEAYAINGAFDRVDYLPEKEMIRILDYKTGKVDLGRKGQAISDMFEKSKLKVAFQGYLYAWLYDRKYPTAKAQVGFYTAKQLSGGIQFLQEGNSIHEEELAEYGRGLQDLIRDIMTEDFIQTEDENQCRICPYQDICNRGR